MRRILPVMLCLAMAAVACSKETPELEPASENTVISVNATIPATRLSADKGKISWSEGDEIAVYNSDGAKFSLSLSEGAGTNYGKFSGSFEGSLNTAIAVYPAKFAGEQPGVVTIPKYVERTDNVDAVMASALSVEGSTVEAVAFHHVMALVEFTLQDVPAYACAIKLFSKTGAQLNGSYAINSSLDGVSCGVGSSEEGTNDRVIYFPYKTAYGADASVKFYVPVAAFDYSDLAVRVLDGDADIIEGTAKTIPAASTSLKAGDYLAMPALNVRSLVGGKRDKFIKVEGVKWAKGNLRAWSNGTSGDGWQDGWNVYDEQWQSQYALLNDEVTGDSKNFTLNADLYKEGKVYTHWDYFSWGTIGRASRVHNQKVISSTAEFDMSGKLFSSGEISTTGSVDISTLTELEGDARFEPNDFSDSNPTIVGDLAFWASKGQFRMPTKGEILKLYAKTNAGAGDSYAHMQAGWYMADGKKINGILFISCPSWETTTYNTGSIELDDADLESGLFIPKAGERTTNVEPNTYTATNISFFNSWGVYWSGTYGGLNSGYEDCARHINFQSGNVMTYGYTSKLSKTITGQTVLGNCIRPVLAD